MEQKTEKRKIRLIKNKKIIMARNVICTLHVQNVSYYVTRHTHNTSLSPKKQVVTRQKTKYNFFPLHALHHAYHYAHTCTYIYAPP